VKSEVRIAISGKRRSGKSTVTDYLLNRATATGYVPGKLSHGRWIKFLATAGLGVAGYDRRALQIFGTEMVSESCRKWFGHRDFWTNLLLYDLGNMAQYGHNFYVCDDVRFKYQADLLKSHGFAIVRLQTTPELQATRDQEGKSVGSDSHPSETDMDDYASFDLVAQPDWAIDTIGANIWGKFVL